MSAVLNTHVDVWRESMCQFPEPHNQCVRLALFMVSPKWLGLILGRTWMFASNLVAKTCWDILVQATDRRRVRASSEGLGFIIRAPWMSLSMVDRPTGQHCNLQRHKGWLPLSRSNPTELIKQVKKVRCDCSVSWWLMMEVALIEHEDGSIGEHRLLTSF